MVDFELECMIGLDWVGVGMDGWCFRGGGKNRLARGTNSGDGVVGPVYL